jgi:sulfur relay (sulfurtransferase) complex TusBCD TusD component (DsrE family)
VTESPKKTSLIFSFFRVFRVVRVYTGTLCGLGVAETIFLNCPPNFVILVGSTEILFYTEGSRMNNDLGTVILITQFGMGNAENPLQLTLIQKYLQLLLEGNLLPSLICFYTEGVKLVAEGSPVIDTLRKLEEKGVHLVVCSTCLSFYGLQDQVQVGVISGMPDIIEAQWRANKVITI